ncbi:MAG: TerC/Alx family metal homeostasis membrane protein [Cetobacterium sp.]|uniref:TerC/Alx family metal homeostasis membrane protein n=1 Tax=Cetobacterium sp. TaxID=2071632 RepID=UPI003EE43900
MLYLLLGVVLALSIYVDFVGHKDGHVMGTNEAIGWSVLWVVIALAFGGAIWMIHGADWAGAYYSGYFLEKALSVDNLMVFTAIFSSFGIRSQSLQHKILLWGIAGALVLRGLFVAAGTQLMALHWSVQLVFAAIVAYSGFMMMRELGKSEDEKEETDYTKHPVVKFVGKFFNVTPSLVGDTILVKQAGKWIATPALACLFVIEISDVVFAFDSVPAVMGITQEPILVYSAMVMAILGLRALYFVLQSLLDKLEYLPHAVVGLLYFVAAKMVVAAVFGIHIPALLSLAVVVGALTWGVAKSLRS